MLGFHSKMAFARRQRQQPLCLSFVTKSCTKQGKKSPFLLCFFILLIGYCSLRPPAPSYDSAIRQWQASKEGENLYFSPKDLPEDLIHSLDAILVLGGGRPKSIDHPPVFVERRCDDAIQVVRRRGRSIQSLKGSQKDPKRDLPILCLSAGTAHLPQLLSADGLPIWESTACASYILSKNSNVASTDTILPASIYVETSSYDTIGNAYFARTSHTEFNGWRKLLIVTNEFHMSRTVKIFDWVFSVPVEATSITSGLNQLSTYDLYYLESPNAGMASEVVAARKEREASSSKSVDFLAKKYSTLREVYEFLTQEHSLYTAHTLVDRGRATAKDVEETSVKDAVKRSYGAS